MKKFGLYINGQFTHIPNSIHCQRYDALTGDYEAEFSIIGHDANSQEALEAALQGACETHKQILQGFFPLTERLEILKGLHKELDKAKENMAQVLSSEVKKPLQLARSEIQRALDTVEWTIFYAKKFFQKSPLPDHEKTHFSHLSGHFERVPNGPVLAITPFNFPINLAFHKIAPAIAAGCPVLFKPSDKALLSALYTVDICHGARVPAGLLNYIPCENSVTQKLVEDERIENISFTGSAKVGWQLARKAPKRVTLELGGNAPVFIDKSADFEKAATRCAQGAFAFAGQSCISVQNVFAHPDAFEPFSHALAKATQQFPYGAHSDENVLCSELIDSANRERVTKELARLSKMGAIVLARSNNFLGKNPEKYFAPTLVSLEDLGDVFLHAELFGPIVSVSKIESIDHWIQHCNGLENRLQCGIFTQDAKHKELAATQLDFGGVLINEAATFRLDAQPYGGQGKAGLGREGPLYALEDYCTWKCIIENNR